MARTTEIRWRNVTVVPLVHGRLAFALEVRRLMLETRYAAVAVELPPSLEAGVAAGLERLPRIHVLLYRDRPAFLAGEERRLWYVTIDPADGIVEALRIARGERTPVHFVDAEVEEFDPRPVVMPDPHALHGLGLRGWYEAARPGLARQPRTAQDALRERHMAARVEALADRLGARRRLLLLCGIAHWEPVRQHLEAGTGALHDVAGPAADQVHVVPVHPRSLIHGLGEMPYVTYLYERHRGGIDPAPFDVIEALKNLLLKARGAFDRRFPEALEKPTLPALRSLLTYLRKLCVSQRRLLPDSYLLTLAARGTVGNDFAVTLLELANRYPPNRTVADAYRMTEDLGLARDEEEPSRLSNRAPGEAREVRPLELQRRPRRRRAARWRRGWNPASHCSWPPEDVTIENFRAYVTRRALTLAGLSLRKTEPFTTSFKDGLAVRESLRDWHLGKIHVKEEPPVAGDVGALVTIFEEDDDGTRFPWRITWYAEHGEESTLAFYATEPERDMVGPGIGRLRYGGCLFLYPPLAIPDVWEDLRFERARRPSERLLLAALFWSPEKFVAHLGPTPPAPEVKAEAARLGRHIVHLPLGTFSVRTLEKMRRAHVLNGREVRSWASRYI